MSKTRNFVFTINNPTITDDIDLQTLEEHVKYAIWGREIGENGTPHYQGYIQFKHPISNRRVSQLLPRAFIDRAKGSPWSNFIYCSKDQQFIELGTRPTDSKKNTSKEQWTNIIQWSESGEIEKIKENYPHAYFLHFRKILSLRQRASGILPGILENEWWYGPTGTGKSKTLWEMHPIHFQKPLNKWWDGYNDEEIVAIEEFYPEAGAFLGHFLKIWADRYPFSPEVKGASLKKIRPKKIIVLSNYHPNDCFAKEQDLNPILRRFKVIKFDILS